VALVSQFSWSDDQTWPNDSPSRIFLARAVHAIGRHLFCGEWSGDEPLKADLPQALPREPARHWYDEAQSILLASGQLASAEPIPRGGWVLDDTPGLSDRRKLQLGKMRYVEPLPFPCPFTQEQWASAVGLREAQRREISDANAAKRSRFDAVVNRMREEAASGALIASLRRQEGGEADDQISRSTWLTELASCRPWFESCAMNPYHPYRAAGLDGRWIFIEKDSLEELLNSESSTNPAPAAQAGSKEPRPDVVEQPTPTPAIVKQAIAARLQELVSTWEQNGRRSEDREGLRNFINRVAMEISGSKPDWARKIWERDRPEEWSAKGPYVD
jgi:hypothetical protein